MLPPVDVPSAVPRWTRSSCHSRTPPPPVGAGELPATDPSIPGMNMTDVSPDRNDPFPNRSFADILTSIEEGSTGAFMIGVGANSFQGLIGNLQILREELRHHEFSSFVQRHRQWPRVSRGRPVANVSLQAGNLMNFMSVSLARALSL